MAALMICTTYKVLEKCKEFLNDYFGDHCSLPKSELKGLGLRLVSLGNPEKTVQGELIYFLRKHGFNAISECGIAGKIRRNLDIAVFDDNWQLVCVIELKHRCVNQGSASTHGSLKKLIENLRGDKDKHILMGIKSDLIQIGLYTEIKKMVPEFSNEQKKEHIYRVLKSYFKKSIECEVPILSNDALEFKHLVNPKLNDMIIDDKHKIIGRVHYVCTQTLSSVSFNSTRERLYEV